MVDCSIIIPAYNEERFLPKSLCAINSAIKEIPEFEWEIIVVDNNSNDKTAEVAISFGAKVVFEPINQISRARNTGAKNSKGAYLFFIDADVSISSKHLKESLKLLSHRRVCGGSAIIEPVNYVNGKKGWGVVFWNFISQRLGYATGQFIYCLREGWESVGGFSENVYAAEDMIFSKSLTKWGRKRGLKFKISDIPLNPSPRKAFWYPRKRDRFWAIFKLAIFQRYLKDRDKCRYYYDRPGIPNNL